MYDIYIKKENKLINKIFGVIWFFLFIFLFLFLIYYYIFRNDIKNYELIKKFDSTVQTSNIVVTSSYIEESDYNDEISSTKTKHYDKIFYYIVDNHGYYLNKSEIDESVEKRIIYYNSANPEEAILESDYLLVSEYFKFHIIITLIFIGLFIFIIVFSRKLNKDDEILNKKGKLIKNIPCTYKENKYDGLPNTKVTVFYNSSKCGEITLSSNFSNLERKNGFIDLLIDEDNPKRYTIRESINRVSGNLSEDYYRKK